MEVQVGARRQAEGIRGKAMSARHSMLWTCGVLRPCSGKHGDMSEKLDVVIKGVLWTADEKLLRKVADLGRASHIREYAPRALASQWPRSPAPSSTSE